MDIKSAGSTFNVVLSSIALFLILLPEPVTTCIGLALLSMLNKPQGEKKRKRLFCSGGVSYGGMVNGQFAFQSASAKQGCLSPAKFAMEPVYANPRDWKHIRKAINDISCKQTDFATARGELPTGSHNIPSMLYSPDEWKTYRASSRSKKTAQVLHHALAQHGQLPQNWPNLPGYYNDSVAWKQSKKSSKQHSSECVTGVLHGNLPLSWPNMPETRFTAKIHRLMQ